MTGPRHTANWPSYAAYRESRASQRHRHGPWRAGRPQVRLESSTYLNDMASTRKEVSHGDRETQRAAPAQPQSGRAPEQRGLQQAACWLAEQDRRASRRCLKRQPAWKRAAYWQLFARARASTSARRRTEESWLGVPEMRSARRCPGRSHGERPSSRRTHPPSRSHAGRSSSRPDRNGGMRAKGT
jgi:hypothetical protein